MIVNAVGENLHLSAGQPQNTTLPRGQITKDPACMYVGANVGDGGGILNISPKHDQPL